MSDFKDLINAFQNNPAILNLLTSLENEKKSPGNINPEEKRQLALKAKEELNRIRSPLENAIDTLSTLGDPEKILGMRCLLCKYCSREGFICWFSNSSKNEKSICTVFIDGKLKFEPKENE